MISFRNVRFGYGGAAPVIEAGTADLGPGLSLVLGPNGCGKSTLMRMAAGVEKPDVGTVVVGGVDLWTHEVEARQQIAYVPEHPDLTPYASIHEVLALVCRLRHVPSDEALDVAERAHLTAYRQRSIRELSLGQRRRVLLAAAWIGAPQVFVLDEPLETMDRPMRRVIREWVRARVDRGDTILLATHEFEGFADLASAAVTVRDGSITCWTDLPSEAARRAELLDDVAAASRSPESVRGLGQEA